jgi:TolB-like protein/class 3 adenylate cyclase/Tfp pilus assembly protein PilF
MDLSRGTLGKRRFLRCPATQSRDRLSPGFQGHILTKIIDTERRLAAIFAADVEGYSRLMGADEVGTLRDLNQRRSILDGLITAYRGRIANTAGDSVLAEFSSAVDAVKCAVEAQSALAEANADTSPDRHINFRIGVHVGDVMVKGGDLFGDGVNIAARLQTLARAGGVCISSVAHDQVRKILPFAFTDLGAQQVKNIEEPVRAFAVIAMTGSAVAGHATASVPLALPDKPSIAVLPFQNMSGDPEQEYFADGIVEDITTALSRIGWLFVISRNSSFTYKGKAIDIKQVGRDLGVRYVLEGSVRKVGSRVRITGQLIDVFSNAHLWADKFDGDFQDIFELQDKVAGSVVGAISPKLEKAEIELSRRKPTENLGAYDYYLRGLSLFYEFSKEAHKESLPLFEKATEIDPQFALAHAAIAGWYITGKSFEWTVRSHEEKVEAEIIARRLLKLSKDDARVLAHAGQTLSYVVGNVEEGATILDRAVRLDPNLAMARLWSGGAQRFLGNQDAAVEQYSYALRLSPLDPRIFLAQTGMASAHFLAGRYDQATEWATKAAHQFPDYVVAHRVALVCHAVCGRADEARQSRELIMRLDPSFRISSIKDQTPYRRQEDIDRLAHAFRIGGVAE